MNYQRSKLEYRKKYTQLYDAAVHNCKNIRPRIKIGEQNALITTSEQFTTAIFALSRQFNKQNVCENN